MSTIRPDLFTPPHKGNSQRASQGLGSFYMSAEGLNQGQLELDSSGGGELSAPSLSISSWTNSSVTIDLQEGSTGATSYQLERSLDESNWTVIDVSLFEVEFPYVNSGLSPSTQYYYRASASDGNSTTSYSASVTVTTNAESAGDGFLTDYVERFFNDVSPRIVHPRPDTETESWEGHRKHYPGKEYYVPIEAFNMAPPLVYELVSGPTGATIGKKYGDVNYGAVRWPNPLLGNYTFTVRVYGQDYNRGVNPTNFEEITWALEVTKLGSLHIDPVNGSDLNDGVLIADGGTGPWLTTRPLFSDGEADTTHSGKQIYLTDGIHELYFDSTAFNPGNGTFEGINKPMVWKGQSQVGTILDFSTTQINWSGAARGWFMDNLTCRNSRMQNDMHMFYGFSSWHENNGGGLRTTFSRIEFTGHRPSDVVVRDFLNTKISEKYGWVPSPSGTNEYYLQSQGGGEPQLSRPFTDVDRVEIYNNVVSTTAFSLGVAGSLADLEYAIGDPDSLGYDTVIVRIDSKSPDLLYSEDGQILTLRYNTIGSDGENASIIWSINAGVGNRRRDFVLHQCSCSDVSQYELSEDIMYENNHWKLAYLVGVDYFVENGTIYGPNYQAESISGMKETCRYFTHKHIDAWNAISPNFEERWGTVMFDQSFGSGADNIKVGWVELWFTKLRSDPERNALLPVYFNFTTTTDQKGPIGIGRCTIANESGAEIIQGRNSALIDDIKLQKNIFVTNDSDGIDDSFPLSNLSVNTNRMIPVSDLAAAFDANGNFKDTYTSVDVTGYGSDVETL